MRQSKLFSKTLKETPKDETSRNAQLLERAGFIYKNLSGVYSYLPLGWRVIRKIEQIIREEMDAVGGEELFLAALQDPQVWQATDRWADEKVGIWFKTKLKDGRELGLATTHEEPLTELMKHHISSHKDLPVYVYQFQTKFRNELRAKSGLMRVREFIMKDLYSFNRSEEEQEEFYEQMKRAYRNVFDRSGIGKKTFLTFASGGTFSKYSHEFQTISDAGEDTVYLDEDQGIAVNKEVYSDEILQELDLDKQRLKKKQAIEVGNIFKLGTKFSEALELFYTDEAGEQKPVVMGSYGIGPGRLMGTIVELCNDQRGIVWPVSVAPFLVHLIELDQNAEEIYQALRKQGIEVLYDDRDETAGTKFAEADLIGIPYRAVVSEQTGDKVEIKQRDSGETKLVALEDLDSELKKSK